jgi:hypothetical protein
MAETARSWEILEAVRARMALISVAGGYRTDAGADVSLEPRQNVVDGTARITLYSGTTVRPDDARSKGEREFVFVAEAEVPAALDNAHAQVVAIAEDIEQNLDEWLPLPSALPLQFRETLYLDKPEGLPAMVAQIMFSTRFRR